MFVAEFKKINDANAGIQAQANTCEVNNFVSRTCTNKGLWALHEYQTSGNNKQLQEAASVGSIAFNFHTLAEIVNGNIQQTA